MTLVLSRCTNIYYRMTRFRALERPTFLKISLPLGPAGKLKILIFRQRQTEFFESGRRIFIWTGGNAFPFVADFKAQTSVWKIRLKSLAKGLAQTWLGQA